EMSRTTVLSGVGHGACMAFRRSALEAIGGFDDWLGVGGDFPAGEDKDGFWRVFPAGWRVVAARAMAVTHVVQRDTAEASRGLRPVGDARAPAVRASVRRLSGRPRRWAEACRTDVVDGHLTPRS